MRILSSEKDTSYISNRWREQGLSVALVPTMGALHEGHLALVRKALALAERVVVSIFVNPTQFGEGEDLDRYPRQLEKDCAALEKLGVHAVFIPDADVIYPEGFSTEVSVSGVSAGLCGAHRPGHFKGVTTVVAVLFGIVKPDYAVFGEKDYQQLAVLRRMNRDLRLAVEIVPVATVREPDGLAMSSRNAYLSTDEREQAPAIRKGMLSARSLASAGETRCSVLLDEFRRVVAEKPLLRIEYAETVDPESMEPRETADSGVLLAAAVYAGNTRLIDNILIEPEV
ncbi:pantoate--beta-alanine ligase [Candidatus Fermentibacteria bacterium]|nr:MAG: pantoate--beta-alanine ligase [Candidatus Fermentibacteria bacterium]